MEGKVWLVSNSNIRKFWGWWICSVSWSWWRLSEFIHALKFIVLYASHTQKVHLVNFLTNKNLKPKLLHLIFKAQLSLVILPASSRHSGPSYQVPPWSLLYFYLWAHSSLCPEPLSTSLCIHLTRLTDGHPSALRCGYTRTCSWLAASAHPKLDSCKPLSWCLLPYSRCLFIGRLTCSVMSSGRADFTARFPALIDSPQRVQ